LYIGVIGGGFAAADHPKPLVVKSLRCGEKRGCAASIGWKSEALYIFENFRNCYGFLIGDQMILLGDEVLRDYLEMPGIDFVFDDDLKGAFTSFLQPADQSIL